MEKKRKAEWAEEISVLGLIIFYLISYGVVIYFGIPKLEMLPYKNDKNVFEIIWDCIETSQSLAVLIFTILLSVISYRRGKKYNKKTAYALSIYFFILYLFNCIITKTYIDQYLVAIVNVFSFVIGSISIIYFSNDSSKDTEGHKSILKRTFDGKINRSHILSVQTYTIQESIIEKTCTIGISLNDYVCGVNGDTNAVVHAQYTLELDDKQKFDSIKNLYHKLIENPDETLIESFKDVLQKTIDDIYERLSKINSVQEVKKEDCCLARLMLIYLAYLERIKGEREWSSEYIGEYHFTPGNLHKNTDVEKRLLTLLKTGLLGGFLVGNDAMYTFSYRDDGYKLGRKYGAFYLEKEDDVSHSKNLLVLVVLKEDNRRSILPVDIIGMKDILQQIERNL